jgi:hypothetical protein
MEEDRHATKHGDARGSAGAGAEASDASVGTASAASACGWVALPVGRADTGATIAELVEAVRGAGGMVGGEALYDPRYEAEMRRFLIRALEMEGIPVPRGGGTP